MKFRARLVVNFDKLKSNYLNICNEFPNHKVLFMVKANAYGHGAVSIVRYAVTELKIFEFGCASLLEALELRRELPDLDFDVYVFSDTQLNDNESAELYINHRIYPFITNLFDLNFVLQHPQLKKIPLCLKFNTGMNRMGMETSEVDSVLEILKSHSVFEIHHLAGHFANSSFSISEDSLNLIQQRNFKELKSKFLEANIQIKNNSHANSGAIAQKFAPNETHIRPGLIMYGPNPLNFENEFVKKFQVISHLEAKVLKVFKVKKDMPIGYNGTKCEEEGKIAICALGYGDGFSTKFTNSTLLFKGISGKVFGRVNMDMVQIFFSEQNKVEIAPNEIFTIWGEDGISLKKFSDENKIIPYEIFCSLLPRISRIYRIK